MTSPPPTRREDVVDVLHGVEVADPYRWLEDGDDPEVQAWLAEQNAPLERRYNYLEERLKHVARIYPYSGKTKSRALPNGTIKLRTEPERLSVVNVSTAAAWAETIPELAEAVEVTVTKRIRQSVLQDYWRSTGIVPEGCEIVPSEIKAYVQLGDDR